MNHFAIYKTSYGNVKFTYAQGFITGLTLLADSPPDMGVETPESKLAFEQLDEYFVGKRQRFDFPYKAVGTSFQQKVWSALHAIPYGETRTYKQIATQIGSPKAARAVGMANNKNPLLIIIPCHRVIATNGKLSGYAAGVALKEKLLTLEKMYQSNSHVL